MMSICTSDSAAPYAIIIQGGGRFSELGVKVEWAHATRRFRSLKGTQLLPRIFKGFSMEIMHFGALLAHA